MVLKADYQARPKGTSMQEYLSSHMSELALVCDPDDLKTVQQGGRMGLHARSGGRQRP